MAGETFSRLSVYRQMCSPLSRRSLSPVELRVSLMHLIGSVQYEVALSGRYLSRTNRVLDRSVRAVKFCTVCTAVTGFTLVPR